MLEDDEDYQSADIFIEPPENALNSDEDSGDEDAGGTLDNLSGNQLRASAEATVRAKGERIYLGDDADLRKDDPGLKRKTETPDAEVEERHNREQDNSEIQISEVLNTLFPRKHSTIIVFMIKIM